MHFFSLKLVNHVSFSIWTTAIFLFTVFSLLGNTVHKISSAPVVITSTKLLLHRSTGKWHPECPERLSKCESILNNLEECKRITRRLPSAELQDNDREIALSIIKKVHDEEYVKEVETLCAKGVRILSPWDADTYISSDTYNTCIISQSAWIDGVNEVAFALTRPPGHHAIKGSSMGFCIFNFAMGAAIYALNELKLKRIGILDFDVHYGNGVADLMADNPNIRYTSLHQLGIFPNSGEESYIGIHNNTRNIALPYECTWKEYEPLLRTRAIPFLTEFNPDLVIVCAGYDALASDVMAQINLLPNDYFEMSKLIKENFGAVLFGLEGGYDVEALPLAIEATIRPYLKED
eukprot:gene8443-17409_t